MSVDKIVADAAIGLFVLFTFAVVLTLAMQFQNIFLGLMMIVGILILALGIGRTMREMT